MGAGRDTKVIEAIQFRRRLPLALIILYSSKEWKEFVQHGVPEDFAISRHSLLLIHIGFNR